MNLPVLIQHIYGEISFTGLYSFEFRHNGKKIVEIFFMMPPKTKDVSEGTRASVAPTLSSNYLMDSGNSVKPINLSGALFFPSVGTPINPLAVNPGQLPGQIDGLTEFFKLRWMLVRYRDYTMTKSGRMDIPTVPMNSSPEITALYKKISKLVKNKMGALYDQIQLVFHDYDMDDHFYCRVANFSYQQSDSKYIAVEYNLALECYERFNAQSGQMVTIKKSLAEEVNISNELLQSIQFSESITRINPQESLAGVVLSNSNFYSFMLSIESILEQINAENTSIQTGSTTPFDNLLLYSKKLIETSDSALNSFINIFLTQEQVDLYNDGDFTIDTVLDITLLSLFNNIQKIKMIAETIKGAITSTPKQNEISYFSNADDYTLTTEQFDSDNKSKVMNDSAFEYYTIQEGDTARIIALRELGDAEKFTTIMQINNISESDLMSGSLIGTKIIIPVDSSSISKSEDNLVYESDFSNASKFLHGSDIASGVNNTLQISATGDILGYSGVQVTYDALMRRLMSQKGSLNVFSPNWGLTPIGDGNEPLMVRIDRYLTDFISQIQADPRVEAVEVDLKKLRLHGESLSVSARITFAGSSETREVEIS